MKAHGGVLVGQAHQRLSDGLRGWLQASFDGVYMVADRGSLIEGAHRLQPELVVVDLAFAEGNVAALLADLHSQAPHSPALLLSDYDDATIDAAALAAGAAGVVHKASLAADLPAAVEAVLAGRPYTSPPGAH
ncbi:MAG: response regulator transcription factor [Burkholderiaceae bacterium]|nr:response regulator transcription factor [Burkholderiaceae bacterium]